MKNIAKKGPHMPGLKAELKQGKITDPKKIDKHLTVKHVKKKVP